MIEKYGKNAEDILSMKRRFFDENDALVQGQYRLAEFYNQQPVRTKCKMCGEPLDNGTHFHSHGVEYAICCHCGHVCGAHEETEAYAQYLYNGSDYGTGSYSAESAKAYSDRVECVYLPKVQFLEDVLASEQIAKKSISVLDIGAGSGYFVSACDDCGIRAEDVEISKAQVKFAQPFLHSKYGNVLRAVEPYETEKVVSETKANVLTLIGVLEHLLDFHALLCKAVENQNIKYIYLSVPTFGMSDLIEIAMPDVFNRHLGGAHTHIFSQESLDYMCRKYNMKMIGKWQFGTDVMDLFRAYIVKGGEEMKKIIVPKFKACMDELQLVLDKNDFCSEIHCVLKVNGDK